MDIVKKDNLYYIGNEKQPLARLEYEVKENTMYINDLFVISHLKGQGIASQLVNEALLQAKEDNLKVFPICSYAKKIILVEEING